MLFVSVLAVKFLKPFFSKTLFHSVLFFRSFILLQGGEDTDLGEHNFSTGYQPRKQSPDPLWFGAFQYCFERFYFVGLIYIRLNVGRYYEIICMFCASINLRNCSISLGFILNRLTLLNFVFIKQTFISLSLILTNLKLTMSHSLMLLSINLNSLYHFHKSPRFGIKIIIAITE